MVTPLGHAGLALVVATPAWLLGTRRRTVTFVGLVLGAALLPDVDVWVATLAHHGITHTVTFVAAVALTGGLVAMAGRLLGGPRRPSDAPAGSPAGAFGFSVTALLGGGLSHLLADAVTTTPPGPPIRPLAPFLDWPVSWELVFYADPVANVGPLAVGLAVHLVVAYRDLAGSTRRSAPGG